MTNAGWGVGPATKAIHPGVIGGSGAITTQTMIFEHRADNRVESQLILDRFETWLRRRPSFYMGLASFPQGIVSGPIFLSSNWVVFCRAVVVEHVKLFTFVYNNRSNMYIMENVFVFVQGWKNQHVLTTCPCKNKSNYLSEIDFVHFLRKWRTLIQVTSRSMLVSKWHASDPTPWNRPEKWWSKDFVGGACTYRTCNEGHRPAHSGGQQPKGFCSNFGRTTSGIAPSSD